MVRGLTISIYVPDGNPKGIKICDINKSIVKSIFIPRAKIKEVYNRKELSDPGIYILIGEKDNIGKLDIYIGEAETLIKRIKQHNRQKDFWNYVVCFVSEKGNLNKAHIKFLENYCCKKAKDTGKCNLLNSNTPTRSSLSEQDEDFALNFYEDIKIIMSALGFSIFEGTKKEKKNIITCKGKKALAEGEYTEEGLVIFKGSKCNLTESKTAGSWVINMRKNLVEKKILKLEKDVYIFKENYTFNSPSAAAAVVLGRRANGWLEWKFADGKNLDKVIRKTN